MSKASAYTSGLLSELLDGISEKEQAKTDKRMLLAARIDDAIKAKGWKKIDFAREMGKKSPSEITKWLSGTHNFNSDTLFDIEEVLGIKLISIESKAKVEVVKYHAIVSDKVIAAVPTTFGNYYNQWMQASKGSVVSIHQGSKYLNAYSA